MVNVHDILCAVFSSYGGEGMAVSGVLAHYSTVSQFHWDCPRLELV